MIRTSWWPYSFNCQNAQAANQLLLSPYRTTVVSLSIPDAPSSSSSLSFGMTSRTTRVAQLRRPVPADRAGHMTLIVGRRVDVDLGDADLGILEMVS